MRPLDRLLQRWRIARASAWIPDGAALLDVGAADGALLRRVRHRVRRAVGLDPALARDVADGSVELRAGRLPDALAPDERFDVVTMLAVIEHVPPEEQGPLAVECARHVSPGGRAILTSPAPAVDGILAILLRLRLVDGMSLEQHYGFDPRALPTVFAAPHWELEAHRTFQLGLNHLFVFRRTGAAVEPPAVARPSVSRPSAV